MHITHFGHKQVVGYASNAEVQLSCLVIPSTVKLVLADPLLPKTKGDDDISVA